MKFVVRCRTCRRIVLSGIERVGVREADALALHLGKCRPDVVGLEDGRWTLDLGALLTHFDVGS